MAIIEYDYNLDRKLTLGLFWLYILVPYFVWQIIQILKKKDNKKKIKEILNVLLVPSMFISLFVAGFFMTSKIIHYPIAASFVALPGLFIFIYSLVYREYEDRYGIYHGIEAFVMGFSYFLLFLGFSGLPILLLGYSGFKVEGWYVPVSAIILFLLPRIIYAIIPKGNAKPIVTYTYQQPDFNYEDGLSDPISFKEAKKLIVDTDWKAELKKKEDLELNNEETCQPQIIFNAKRGIFSVIVEDEGKFKVYVDIHVPAKLLDIIPWSNKLAKTSKVISEDKAILLLQYYFDGDLEKIRKDL